MRCLRVFCGLVVLTMAVLPVGAQTQPADAAPAPGARVSVPSAASDRIVPPRQPELTPNQPSPLSALDGLGSDYQIGPNDLIDIEVFGVPDLKRTVRVNSSGMVSLALVGNMQLAGMTGEQAEARIAAKYGEKYLQDPQVSIFIREFTSKRITIEGAVSKPGIYPVTGQLTLLRAIALAGGGAQYANLADINLFRQTGNAGGQQTLKFDLEMIRKGEAADPVVLADDVIVVNRSAARTALRDSLFRDIIDSINPFSVLGPR